ncbi:MAG TPA: phosphatase PAP2 family protein [Acidimicrobiia bacterium]|nr:phosphatase PAP2 family protein [Acidimicrobiia bacterium]
MPNHPVLIVNPRSGNGRAAAIDLIHTAQQLDLETVTMQPGDDLAELSVRMVDGGCDHLMMAGGDGSLAIVAEVAMARDVPFSCVPVGTRNHFAMDLGLDRSHPLQSLDAALDGVERLIDVGIVAGQFFLNNVSFGLYPRAIADPEYRSHRARSMADAAVDSARNLESQLTLTSPDGRVVSDVEVLLISNNPYRFIGPPDFARRPALDTGALGIILADRLSRVKREPAAFTRWETPTLTVHADPASIKVGVDGELRTLQAPIEVALEPKSLRVLVPRQTQPKRFKESIEHLNERTIVHLSGLPTLPSRDEVTVRSPLLRQLDEVDEAVFERIAGWESPAMDRIMPALSQAASHSKIWMTVAVALAIVGGKKGRTTAVESLAAVGITSLRATVVAKGLFRRSRPTDQVPEERRLPTPGSSSMPSGHTASGAAFARVVGAAYPGLRIPLNALAAAIGFSRVYTGVHYPTDVIAGWLLGRGIGSLTQRVAATAWRVPRSPARPRVQENQRP